VSGRISIYRTRSLGDGMAFVHNEPVNTVSLDDVGHIATASGTVDGFGALTLWDAGSGMMQKEWRLDDFILGDRVALSNDGRYMLLGTGTPVACSATETRLWSIEDDREISAIDHSVCGAPASLSADGRFFAYARFNGQIEVLELPAGKIRGLGSGNLKSLKFSESGSHLAAGLEDGPLKVWETNDWQVVFEPGNELPDRYNFLTLDPGGTKLALTTGDNIVLVFSLAGGSADLQLKHLGRVTAMAFDTTGTQLTTGAEDGRARIWSMATGDEIAQFPHSAGVSAVVFGENDTTLVTASVDGYARIWNVQDRAEMGRLPHGAELTDLAVSKICELIIARTLSRA
jgi:WD40 repeat protein